MTISKVENTSPSRLPVTLASGAVLALGEQGEADSSKPHDKALIDSGAVTRVPKAKRSTNRKSRQEDQ